MRSVRNHNDPANVAGNFGAVVHSRDRAYQHGDQHAEADRPHAGLKYLTERCAASSPHDRGYDSLQSELAGP